MINRASFLELANYIFRLAPEPTNIDSINYSCAVWFPTARMEFGFPTFFAINRWPHWPIVTIILACTEYTYVYIYIYMCTYVHRETEHNFA